MKRVSCALFIAALMTGSAVAQETFFKGKTLRQLARSAKGRPDAISWLRQQERILRSNPQLTGLDMRTLWEELALPFQGLETDPAR